MTDSLQVFAFGGRNVRTAGTHEAPLFCGADVCIVLGLATSGKDTALARLDDDERILVKTSVREKSVKAPNLNIGPPAMVYVTESGLYALIISCEKPEAKVFKKWVTSEVLPAIRKQGYYSAVEAERAKTTKELLAQCFPEAPAAAKPIFSKLISALLTMRQEPQVGNPAWAPLLASIIYDFAIPIPGQQTQRRALNGKPSFRSVDHAMFSPEVREKVMHVVRGGILFAKTCVSWKEWRAHMETAFNDEPLQLSMMTIVRRLPNKVG